MKKIVNYYPVLQDELMNKVNSSVNYSFFYVDKNGTKIEIEHDETIGNNISLCAKNTNWNPYEDDIFIDINISIDNGSLLYGENGVAPIGSKIGMCVEYYSKKSKYRDVVVLNGYLENDERNYTYTFPSVLIKNNTFFSDVDISILCYLKESSNSVNNEQMFLNNSEGVILGSFDNRKLFLYGTGSLFPIYVEGLETNNLWDFEFDYENPEIDSFSDCAKLVLNSNSSEYCLIDPNSSMYCDRLVLEIITNCLYLVFIKLKDDGYLDEIDSSYLDGSIMSFVSYYKNTFSFSFIDSKAIFNNLHNFVSKEYHNV